MFIRKDFEDAIKKQFGIEKMVYKGIERNLFNNCNLFVFWYWKGSHLHWNWNWNSWNLLCLQNWWNFYFIGTYLQNQNKIKLLLCFQRNDLLKSQWNYYRFFWSSIRFYGRISIISPGRRRSGCLLERILKKKSRIDLV